VVIRRLLDGGVPRRTRYEEGTPRWRIRHQPHLRTRLRGEEPTVAGLRFAATRDLNAFLRNSESGRGNGNGNGNGHCNANDRGNGHAKCPHDTLGPANPLGDAVHYAIIYGSSQSGRWIRTFIELGFNEDENENRVFDGAIPHKASKRGAFNVRFAQPTRLSGTYRVIHPVHQDASRAPRSR
jgi:hypothetical protein